MTDDIYSNKIILAVAPFSRGFGFAVFEGPRNLIDWGVKEIRSDKNNISLKKIESMIDFYWPDILIIEDPRGENRRRTRVRILLDSINKLGKEKKVTMRSFTRPMVRQAFETIGAATKFQISQVIADEWPELKPYLPRFRKPWMSEDCRMSIFDAISLAITYFYYKTEKEFGEK
jgi:Holliday junction resolvasome RuvABC endonuclease subunit